MLWHQLTEFDSGLLEPCWLLEVRSNSERIEATVVNRAGLPTGYSTTGRHTERAGGEVILELHLATGARLLSGEARVELSTLGGGARSEATEWLLLAPRGTLVSVTARSPFCATVEREVRL